MSTLNKKGIRLHRGQWITRQEYLSIAKPSSSSPPLSSTPSSSQTAYTPLLEGINLLQHFVTELMNHIRYLEHGLKMVMSPALHEEFESDKILFGINSESEQDESETSSSSASLSTDTSSSDASEDDAPLIRHFKHSKTVP